MSRLRILLLVTNLGQGGAQRAFYDQAVWLSQHHDVEEAVFDLTGGERIYDSGLPMHLLGNDGWLFRLGPLGRLAGRALALRRLVRRGRFDVVISHMDGANWVNVLAGSPARKILVVHGTVLHDDGVTASTQLLRRALVFPLLYNRADRTVGVSAGIVRELERTCGVRNAMTIANSFDVAAIEARASEPVDDELARFLAHPLALVTSGRLAVQKNQVWLFDIVAELIAQGHRVRLVVLGDGPLHADLVARARGLGLRVRDFSGTEPVPDDDDADVWFAGYLANPFACLAKGGIFVFPSAWEGYPLALCEAMICGLPVISADCPTGPREILAPGSEGAGFGPEGFEIAENGVLAPIPRGPDDVASWVAAILRLARDPALRATLASNARMAGDMMDRSHALASWLALLAEVSRPHEAGR